VVLAASGAAAGIAAAFGDPRGGSAAAAGAGLAVLAGMHVVPSLRRPRRPAPELSGDARRIRKALPVLSLVGAASAVLAQHHRLAGEPLAALLIGRNHTVDAALVAFITAAAFFPLVAVSSVASDSYSTQGTPDWILGIGYLLSRAWLAGLAGAAAMSLEVLFARRSCQLILSLPELSETAAAVREAMGDVMHLALPVGGLLLGARLGGALGFTVVGAAWMLNEGLGRPVMRLAVGPTAAIAVCLGANLWMQIR
jgi:hypothetical protein